MIMIMYAFVGIGARPLLRIWEASATGRDLCLTDTDLYTLAL